MNIDRSNKNWNTKISDEDILNEEFSIGYLLQTNLHNPLLAELKDKVLSTYNVTAKFEWLGYNGASIYCNGQKLVYRKDKFSNFSIGKNVQVIEHNLSTNGGGSNNYPSIAYKGASIILQFISYGLPYVNKTNGWNINIISLDKIE